MSAGWLTFKGGAVAGAADPGVSGRVQQNIIAQGLRDGDFRMPLAVRMLMRNIPGLRNLPLRLMAFGFRRPRLISPTT